MKTAFRFFALTTLAALSVVTLRSQTTTVLEGFEEFSQWAPDQVVGSDRNANISLWTQWGGRAASGQVNINLYTATSPDDPRVTEGTNSIAVTFLKDGFGNDLGVVLDDLATAAIENAASSNQLARYILRYDVIFEHADQYIYFNQHALIGNDWNYVNLGGAMMKTNNGVVYGVVSFSEPLDIANVALPTSGPLASWWNGSWIVTDQFATTQPTFTNCTIYIDNVRLVDTYAPNSTPVVYPLLSFEDAAKPLGGAVSLYPTVTTFFGNPTSSRATLSQFTTNGLYNSTNDGVAGIYTTNKGPIDGDFAVTEGTHALQVSNRFPGNISFQFDFAIPFAGTKLAEVLAKNLPLSELAHYTLRWDTTMPAVWAPSSDGDYMNMVFCTGATYLPMAQGRRQSLNQVGLQRATYSVTLDQIAAWGNSPVGGDPALIVAFNGASEGIPYIYYYDNFVLIDTAPPPPTITSWNFDPVSRQFTLTWTSMPGATYSVLRAATLASGGFSPAATGIASGGSQTTTTVTMPAGDTGFLRVVQQ